VKVGHPVMRAGRMEAHYRRAPGRLERPHVRYLCQRFGPCDLVRRRAYGFALFEVGRARVGRQLGIALVQAADPGVKLNRPLGPAGRPRWCRLNAVHLLVVSHRRCFHKGQRSRSGKTGLAGLCAARRWAVVRPYASRGVDLARCGGWNASQGTQNPPGWFNNRSERITPDGRSRPGPIGGAHPGPGRRPPDATCVASRPAAPLAGGAGHPRWARVRRAR